MLSKNQLKLITSLRQKKYRIKHKLFVVEGAKGVLDFLNSDFELVSLFCLEQEYEKFQKFNPVLITAKELATISGLSTPNKLLALFRIPEHEVKIENELTVALDGINDPGNLGTIIRLCDWFGVRQLICSNDTVDCYNPKVVMATMGSLARIKILYLDLKEFIRVSKLPVYGSFMDGENIYKLNLNKKSILVMGNEANGISNDVEALIDLKVAIPKFNKDSYINSLNVATATAILLNELRRD